MENDLKIHVFLAAVQESAVASGVASQFKDPPLYASKI